ncbi:MAG: class I SAM-dependent rRNA methyltransferase [candidate division WOR-3 bacterium]
MPQKVVHIIRKKSRRDHLWIFANEIRRTEGNPIAGDTVLVYERGKLIGSGLYNPHSLIRIRLYSKRNEEFDLAFIKKRIEDAYQYRKQVLPQENDFRLIFGESDFLPGIVIDKYGDHFTLQTFTLATEQRKELICQALSSLFPVKSIFEKNDFRLRDIEQLPRQEGLLYGAIEDKIVINENQAKFYVDIKGGQKTGYFFDHRLTRAKVRTLSQGRNVLDVFCYTGGFSINSALGGAKTVTGIDGSVAAIELAKENAKLNQVEKICQFEVGDAFRLLRQYVKEEKRFDLIVLDPPPFIKSLKEKKSGLKGYKEINLQAMKLLNPGGILVTSSCSHYLFWQDLLDILIAAAQDAQRSFKIIDRTTQGPDHPIILSMPETEYLRCFFLTVN